MSTIDRRLPVLILIGIIAITLIVYGQQPHHREVVREGSPQNLRLLTFPEKAVSELTITYASSISPLHSGDVTLGNQFRGERLSLDESGRTSDEVTNDRDLSFATGSSPGRLVLKKQRLAGEVGPATWQLSEPVSAAANNDLLSQVVQALAQLDAFRYIDPDDTQIDLSAFGLNPPRAIMEIKLYANTADEAKQTLLIGLATPIIIGEHETYYVQLPGDDEIYVAGGIALALVNVPADMLVDINPRPPAGGAVEEVTTEAADDDSRQQR